MSWKNSTAPSVHSATKEKDQHMNKYRIKAHCGGGGSPRIPNLENTALEKIRHTGPAKITQLAPPITA